MQLIGFQNVGFWNLDADLPWVQDFSGLFEDFEAWP